MTAFFTAFNKNVSQVTLLTPLLCNPVYTYIFSEIQSILTRLYSVLPISQIGLFNNNQQKTTWATDKY